MKSFAQAAIIFMVVIVAVFVSFNLVTGNVTDTEAEKSLSQSVEQALYVTLKGETHSVENKDEFIAEFMTNLVLQTQSKSELTVRVLEADEIEGLLDIEVTETLTYPDGKIREIKCRRTVLFEEEVA